jgi:hypothetical protein
MWGGLAGTRTGTGLLGRKDLTVKRWAQYFVNKKGIILKTLAIVLLEQ